MILFLFDVNIVIVFVDQGEIRLPVVLEDQCHREVPNIQLFYRPVRQMVYAILFNLHHHTFLAEKQRENHADKQDGQFLLSTLHSWIFLFIDLPFFLFFFFPITDPATAAPANSSAPAGGYVPPATANCTPAQCNPLVPEIKIREWVWTAANPYRHPEIVTAVPVGWPVPTVHRLWFGTSLGKSPDRRRLII